MHACMRADRATAELLLAAGADPALRDGTGASARDYAREVGCVVRGGRLLPAARRAAER